jgi:hypothetical protein
MPSATLFQRNLGAGEDDGQLGSDGGEGVGDAPLGEPPPSIDACSQGAPERAAHRETDHRRVDERLDHGALGGGEVGDAQMGLELPEDELDLPAGGVGPGDLGGREHEHGRCRDERAPPSGATRRVVEGHVCFGRERSPWWPGTSDPANPRPSGGALSPHRVQ